MNLDRAKAIEWAGKNRTPIGAAIGVALVVAIAIAVLAGGGGSTSASNRAEIVSVDQLHQTATAGDTPVYWAGERPGSALELSHGDSGRTYVRYLTGGAEAGDPRPDFLTVGTYKVADAVAVLRRQGHQPDGVLATGPRGATVYFSRTRPHSVYLAYPGVGAEIEVYDPSFERALRLVNSGRIVPAG